MKKLIIIVLTLFLVPMLFGIDHVPRTRNRIQEQVRISIEDIGTQVPYWPRGGERHYPVLFVEDPGGIQSPNDDSVWHAVLDSTLGIDNYGWFGPTTSGDQNGPTLTDMQNYYLVIWNTFGAWATLVLTETDQTNIQDYISGGGKVWLISQDAFFSGVPLTFFQTNFNLESVEIDYLPGFPSINIQGLSEIAGNSFSMTWDYYPFYPDALTPNTNAHHIVEDIDNSGKYPCILSDDFNTSFWTVDGQNPSSWADWQQMVYDMLDIFDCFIFHDVGPVSIDIPPTVPEDTTLRPHATVANFALYTETFSVICTIEPGAYTSTTVSNIGPGDSIQVTFPDDFHFVSGIYTITVFTQLVGDDQSANDTLETVIETYDPGIAEGDLIPPASFSFGLRNNPAKGKALFNLTLPEAGTITLRIYDVSGRLIDILVSGRKSAGTYEIPWTKEATAGVYFYKFESPWNTEVGKLVLVR